MKMRVEIDEKTLRELIEEHLRKQLGSVNFEAAQILIEVKSKQNYRSEWESSAFRAVLEIFQ